MSKIINDKIYKESTAAQLLKPRVDLLTSNGGLNYYELNKRILADNVTENKKNDHNPIYGGISKEVCAVERQESFTISDRLESFDKNYYTLSPRKVFVKTSDTTVVTEANGFFGDDLKINVNKLLDLLSTKALFLDGLPVEGSFELDKTKLIVDESFKNPWDIDFSDESNIILNLNPFKENVIPVIFKPSDKKLNATFLNISLLILDEREEAVIPELSNGLYVKVSELNETNATSFKTKKGELKINVSGVIEGDVLNSKTKEALTSVTCTVLSGNVFPEMPTSFDMSGVDEVTKLRHTLYANVKIEQASIRDLNVVLPVVYLADERDEYIPITSLTFEQNSDVDITYLNSGNTFKGEVCILDSSVVSPNLTVSAKDANNDDVELVIEDTVVEKSLNKNQSSSKATVSITDVDGRISTLKYPVKVNDTRPIRTKEVFKVTSNFSVTITASDFNAGLKGQAWVGNSLSVNGSVTKIENQFGKTILPSDILYYSFNPINVNARVLEDSDKSPLEILPSEESSGSTEGKAKLYVLLKDFTVLELDVDISVTDERTDGKQDDLIKIITNKFNVTNDYDQSSSPIVIRSTKEAYTVVEVANSDWQTLQDRIGGNIGYSTFMIMNMSYSTDLTDWTASFQLGRNSQNADIYIILSTTPLSENPHCSLTTMKVPLMIMNSETEVPDPLFDVTVKTYIDSVENTDNSFVPVMNDGMNVVDTTIEGGEPIERQWFWKTNNITDVNTNEEIYYKIAIDSLSPDEEENVKQKEWLLMGEFRTLDDKFVITLNDGGIPAYIATIRSSEGFAYNGIMTLGISENVDEVDIIGYLYIQAFKASDNEMIDHVIDTEGHEFEVGVDKITE